MLSKKIGILNTLLCLCLLLFVLVFIQMNNQIRETIDQTDDDDGSDDDTTSTDPSGNPQGVYLYQNLACTGFTLTPDGFSCAEVVMNDISIN